MHNIIAFFITLILALIWLRINNYFAHKGWISSGLSRKIIHIGTGPIYVLCWLIFENNPSARYLAAIIPLAISLQFFLVGIGIIIDESAVKSMSRSGDRREILRGPLYYGILFIFLTIVFWYDSPIGIVALMLMCGGDGMADILGRRFGAVKLPWNNHKSWIGSLSMLISGWVTAILLIWIFLLAGAFQGTINDYTLPLCLIAFGCTVVESLPLRDIDNITITVTAIILGFLFL